jgi:ribosomal protein S18 acetylase RimI-like enzyme
MTLQDLLEARRAARLIGAAWAQVMPGKMASIWPPRVVAGEGESTVRRLLDAAEERIVLQGVHVSHALLPRSADRDAELLVRRHFQHVADLLYLGSTAEQFPVACPPGDLQFQPYRDSDRDRLAHLVEETYVGTLDIPAMNGMRRIEDILGGYRQTGGFDPERWLLVVHRSELVGCLLLADHVEQGHWELMYMGLTPSARGRGWGLQMTRYAQWLARNAGCRAIIAAVDRANGPAIATYARAGFMEWERRRVFLKAYAAERF